jgi:hypothetical protein
MDFGGTVSVVAVDVGMPSEATKPTKLSGLCFFTEVLA